MTILENHQIDVRAFHHVLLWPLIMRQQDGDATIADFIRELSAVGWQEQQGKNDAVHNDFKYEEVVYFHPFVRDFLFGDGATPAEKRSLRRFSRSDVQSLTVAIQRSAKSKTEPFKADLTVERLEILLVRPRIAIVLLEVSNRIGKSPYNADPQLQDSRLNDMKLDQVMLLQGQLRHIYPAYFNADGSHGDCLTEFQWNCSPTGKSYPRTSETEFRDFTRQAAEPPMYSHWQFLFGEKIQPLKSSLDRRAPGLFLQQLLDDRMPAMSFITVDRPHEIHPDDEDRFPAFDPPGFSYEPEFNRNQRHLFRYTRFRHLGTTYYCNGTSFTAVTGSDPEFGNLLLSHFRRHYTHIAMISQFQHAALLYFADELASVAKDMALDESPAAGVKPPEWRDRIRRLQYRFLKFRTRSYFTEVSNQIQGKDLFRLWYDRLGTSELFDRVSQTSNEVYQALENDEMKNLAFEQKRLADVANMGLQLSIVIAVVGVVVATFGAVLCWAALMSQEQYTSKILWSKSAISGASQTLIIGLVVSAAVVMVLLGFYKRLMDKAKDGKKGFLAGSE